MSTSNKKYRDGWDRIWKRESPQQQNRQDKDVYPGWTAKEKAAHEHYLLLESLAAYP